MVRDGRTGAISLRRRKVRRNLIAVSSQKKFIESREPDSEARSDRTLHYDKWM